MAKKRKPAQKAADAPAPPVKRIDDRDNLPLVQALFDHHPRDLLSTFIQALARAAAQADHAADPD